MHSPGSPHLQPRWWSICLTAVLLLRCDYSGGGGSAASYYALQDDGPCTAVAPGQQDPRCGLYACGVGECETFCESNAQCALNARCSWGTCRAQQPVGSACQTANECASGFCVDRVCCASSCSGACDRCDVPGLLGTCSMPPDAPMNPFCSLAYRTRGRSPSRYRAAVPGARQRRPTSR